MSDSTYEDSIHTVTDIERLSPLGARIFIKPDAPADRHGSIIIPDRAKRPAKTGVVVAMGPGMLCSDGTRWPMPDCAVGDRVVYNEQNPYPRVKIGDVEYLQMRDDDVLAVVTEG
jgi:co-chaperonin GroES (HSP10)